MRIVSLVPSWTEYLIDLGLSNQLKGRTKFCVRVGDNKNDIAVIGGTKTFHVEKVESLQPDLIIASKEENDQSLVEACSNFSDVLLTDVKSIHGAVAACQEIARATKKEKTGRGMVRSDSTNLGRTSNATSPSELCRLEQSIDARRTRYFHTCCNGMVGH